MQIERKMDELVSALRDASRRNKKCTLLIGAGCSVKAGIPLAAEFVEIIKDRNRPAYDRAMQKTYPHCMAELPPAARRDLISEFVDKARINWAHIAIAQLMRHGYIDRVLTVNFDPLVVQACALLGEFPAVYDFAASQLFKPADIPDKAVFHLHGQRSGFRLLHTEQEVEAHSQSLAPVFDDAGRGRMWIVVGYSGENDPVFDHLANVPQFDNELYWVTYKDSEPSADVRNRLLQPGKYAFYLKGYDGDGFFVTLAQRLRCFPPDFVGRPFTHLHRMLDFVAPFDLPNQDAEFTVKARDWIGDAIARYEEGAEASANPTEENERRQTERSAMEALTQLLAGDYTKADEVASRITGKEVVEIRAWAHVMSGNALSDQAKTKAGAEADRLFAEAEKRLSRAELLAPSSAAYNLACLAAIRGLLDEARSWLSKAREGGKLPPPTHLQQDTDLDNVRDTTWFCEFLAGA